MTRRSLLAGLGGALAAQTNKPNVIIILADDLGIGDVGCYWPDAKVKTPNLDRLGKQGVRFTDAHSPSSVCTPTRYGLMTGRYCWRSRLKSGVLSGDSPNLIEPGRETIATLFQKAGYRTGVFGKWHLGLGSEAKTDYSKELKPSPLEHGFNEFFGIPASLDMPPYVYVDGRRAVEMPTNKIGDNGETKRGPYWRGGGIAPGFVMEEVVPKITSRAVDFVKKPGPYFCYIPLPAPHTPWVPAREFQGKSRAKLYGDFVEQLDHSVGQIVDAAGDPSNTLVIVTSDNGAPWEKRDMEENGGQWANGMLRGQKSDTYEGGHRVPFLARWNGKIKGGTVSDAPVCHVDLMATVCEAAGVEMKGVAGEDSFSMMPAMRGAKKTRPHLIHHSGSGMFAIREGEWKLIEGLGSGGFTQPARIAPKPGGPTGQLFHLSVDPYEREDLYTKHPEQVARLTALLNQARNADRTRPA
ncbi:MAG: arylsulfatase [Acidobacteria bacterium]|nr:arylsulfatase [Acidobacteriota bacterium]